MVFDRNIYVPGSKQNCKVVLGIPITKFKPLSCMGGCLCKTFTVNRRQDAKLRCIQPFVFSVSDAENVLMESEMGDYLLYRDYTTDRILLSVRYNSHIRHHRISEDNGLYYLNGQPYPYLDSIVLYHRRHRLDSIKLKKQAQLSARVVRLFAHKMTNTNHNNVHTLDNENTPPQTEMNGTLIAHYHHLLTSSPTTHVDESEPQSFPWPVILENNANTATPNENVLQPNLDADGNSPTTYFPKNSPVPVRGNNMIASTIAFSDVVDDASGNGCTITGTSWVMLEPNGHASDFNHSTISSQASLLSSSSSDSNQVQIERL